MRALLLAALLAATAVQAQEATSSRPTGRQIARMTALGTACGLAAGIVVSPVGAVPVGLVLVAAAFPAGAATCVLREAERDGFGGHFTATFVDAALGAALGVATGYATGRGAALALTLAGVDGGDGFIPAVVGGAVGLVVFTGTSAYVAARRVHRHGAPGVSAAPVALRLPDGTTTPGVTLRIGL